MPDSNADEQICHSYRGYHKPIMIAGGIGQITTDQLTKIKKGSHIPSLI